MKENPLTMEMLLDQLTGLNIIQIAIPLILLVILEWILTIVQKKGYYNSRHHIRYIYRVVNVGISALLKIGILESYYFFTICSMEHSKRMVGLLYYCYRFFLDIGHID
jgi:hypothetical protein